MVDLEQADAERERMRQEYADAKVKYEAEQHRQAVMYHRLDWLLHAMAIGVTLIFISP